MIYDAFLTAVTVIEKKVSQTISCLHFSAVMTVLPYSLAAVTACRELLYRTNHIIAAIIVLFQEMEK